MNKFVKICDVTLRDGIQNIRSTGIPLFSTSQKLNIINRLNMANISQIEFGSNVSHTINEMKNTRQVIQSFDHFRPIKTDYDNSKLFLLVPSYKKFIEAYNWTGINYVTHVSLITACSDGFTKKNTKMSVEQSLAEIDNILKNSIVPVRIYISCCFGCPIEGTTNKTHLDNIEKIVSKYSNNKMVYEIVLSDTIGNYSMSQIEEFMKMFGKTNKISLHIHTHPEDQNIITIVNKFGDMLVSLDTSLGQLGGCPNVEKKDIKPNLSTLKTANIINQVLGFEYYKIKPITELEYLVNSKTTN